MPKPVDATENETSINDSNALKKRKAAHAGIAPSKCLIEKQPLKLNGYRYILAEPDPVFSTAECRRYRQYWNTAGVFASINDRSRAIGVADDALTVSGGRLGYRSVIANHGVASGDYYFEVLVRSSQPADDSHVRLGLMTLAGEVNGPVGFDKHGYSLCDSGKSFHAGKLQYFLPYQIVAGDIVGFRVRLPTPKNAYEIRGRRVPIRYYGVYFEEQIQLNPHHLEPLPNSFIQVFVNGNDYGMLAENILSGEYYPAASLYHDASTTFNFGPKFVFWSDSLNGCCHPFVDCYKDRLISVSLTDLIEALESNQP